MSLGHSSRSNEHQLKIEQFVKREAASPVFCFLQ